MLNLLFSGLVLAFTLAKVSAQPLPPVGSGAYPGTLVLKVDATDIDRKILRVRETLPVRAGPLVLYYPNWIPGHHANVGPISQFAGLVLRAGDRVLDWKRNTVETHAFHVEVPAGVNSLDIEFQYLSPVDGSAGAPIFTREMIDLAWNRVLLYPAGFDVSRIQVQPSLVLPAGWQHGSALELAATDGNRRDFRPLSVEMLVDSPVLAGLHFKQFDLDPGATAAGRPPVMLNVVAEEASQLAATPEQIAAHAALVTQADKLFGTRHYRHYDVLLALSEGLGFMGLEHHQSSENGVKPEYFTEWPKGAPARFLIPHEYTHSWNGKFRRPADLATPNFNTPMRNTLLWVYEGQTEFWGEVLTARSGLRSAAEARESLASSAARFLEGRPGRAWRTLQDTTNEALLTPDRWQRDWRSWQRGEDYYVEMTLVWIEADALIREGSQGARSLDDFARDFFGAQPGRDARELGPLPYTFDDVVRALGRVQPYDWAAFLRQRLDGRDGGLLAAGLRRAGWQLAWSEQQSDFDKNADAAAKSTDFWFSLGFSVGEEGKLEGVRWDSPAFQAGLTKGQNLLAVNSRAYKADNLREAITAAKANARPIELLFKSGDLYRSVAIDYRGGLRYPKLERVDGSADQLGALLAPR